MATSGDAGAIGSPSAGAPGQEANLRSSLADLAQLTMGHGQQGLEALLRRVAQYAVRAIPGADGAGVTLLEADLPDTVAASTEFVKEVDAVQYGIGEGPCISAASTGCTVTSGDLRVEERWPLFGPAVDHLGVHSALSIPLKTASRIVGAINVYAHARNAFDERSIELGELFAIPAATSVHNARVLAQTRRLIVQVQEAVSRQAVIDRAVGVLMSRDGTSAADALVRLDALRQRDESGLHTAAQRIVDDATRRPKFGA